jgi:hypothetical protein
MLLLGVLCIVLDFNIGTGLHYPQKYENTKATIGEFQYYNIATNYNAYCDYKMIEGGSSSQSADSGQTNVSSAAKVINNIYYKDLQVDLFNDFLGFLLIIIACLSLKQCSRKFSFASFTALCGLILHGLIVAFPFFLNGIVLCYFAFFIGMGFLAVCILTLFFIVMGLFQMCPGVACRDERKWCRMIWYVIAAFQALSTFSLWLGADLPALHNLGITLEVISVLMVLLFWKVLFRTYDYLENTYKEASLSND